jgi:DNA-binding winged helix-turn-helix (wHTH) protein
MLILRMITIAIISEEGVNGGAFSSRQRHRCQSDEQGRMTREIIQFEEYELDPGSFELRREGRLVKVERIPLQLLFLLAENRDRLVSREDILEAIWAKNQFVDADNSINTAVRKARQALRDDPENPRFLRTVSGKGYRLTGQVQGRYLARSRTLGNVACVGTTGTTKFTIRPDIRKPTNVPRNEIASTRFWIFAQRRLSWGVQSATY